MKFIRTHKQTGIQIFRDGEYFVANGQRFASSTDANEYLDLKAKGKTNEAQELCLPNFGAW
jgi:hypothetical protein